MSLIRAFYIFFYKLGYLEVVSNYLCLIYNFRFLWDVSRNTCLTERTQRRFLQMDFGSNVDKEESYVLPN